MTREPLVEFIASQPLRPQMVCEHAGFFQHRQGPIERRLRHVDDLRQFSRRERAICPGQRCDHRATSPGVADLVFEEPELYLPVQCRFGQHSLQMIMILNVMIMSLISGGKSRILLLVPAIALCFAACGDGQTEGDGVTVVATTSIWGDVAAEIVGDAGTIEVLIPMGSDAHDYQATPRQVASLIDADLVIVNGLGLEEGLSDVLESAHDDGANLLEVGPAVDPLPFGENEHEDEDDHGDLDPHVWFDPARAGEAALLIAEALGVVEPGVDWETRAETYRDEMVQLSSDIETTLAEVPESRRKLVTNHEALGYFADTFDFEVVGVVIPGGSTLADPSSAELAALVEVIETEQVGAIFTETSQPDDLARAVATEVGEEIAVVELHTESLGDPPADTLAGMLQENADRIANALR